MRDTIRTNKKEHFLNHSWKGWKEDWWWSHATNIIYIICHDLGTWYQIINKYSGNEKQTVRWWDGRDGSNGR